MPIGLINTKATYPILGNMLFKNHIGKNMEIYVDEMMVKTQEQINHVEDLKEILGVIRKYGMRSNLKKCVLDVESVTFL